MSAERKEIKPLSAAEYERMCQEVRAEFGPRVMPEVMLYALCKKVYHHAHGYREDLRLPYSPAPREEVYRETLWRLVAETRAEPFDEMEVARRYLDGI